MCAQLLRDRGHASFCMVGRMWRGSVVTSYGFWNAVTFLPCPKEVLGPHAPARSVLDLQARLGHGGIAGPQSPWVLQAPSVSRAQGTVTHIACMSGAHTGSVVPWTSVLEHKARMKV